MWSGAVLLLTAILVATAGQRDGADAFTRQTQSGPGGVPVQLFWRDAEKGVPFRINRWGSDDVPDDSEFEAIRQGFKTWEEVPTATIRFVDQGLTDQTRIANDGINLVVFDETGRLLGIPKGTGAIAMTRVHSDERTGEISDTDLVFNGRDFTFTTSGRTGPGIVDVQEVATHEIGHVLGLDHTGLWGAPEITPTMNPYSEGGPHAEGRTLERDDIAGVSTIYPTPDFFARTGRVSGAATKIDGSGVFGAHVIAYEAHTRQFTVSCLSGFRTGRYGKGQYTIFGLVPGDYLIGIEPLNGRITERNFGGIFRGFDVNFPREFFDNASDPERATVVRVTAGEEVRDIDFVTGFLVPGAPVIAEIAPLRNTEDTVGPYPVAVRIRDDKGVREARLYYRTDGGAFLPVSLRSSDGEIFEGLIPGQPSGTTVEYYVEAEDEDGNVSVYPFGAPDIVLRFEVFERTGRPLAYIAARRSDEVVVLDTGNHVEIARISVRDEPIAIALTPDDSLLFVANSGAGLVSVLRTADHTLAATIPVGSTPLGLAVSPDGRRVYVGNAGSNSVSVLDVESLEVVRTFSVPVPGKGPYGIALSPDGRRLYATHIDADAVSVLDASAGDLLAIVPVVDEPRALAVTPDGGKVYVTSFSEGKVSVLDATADSVSKTISLSPTSSTFEVAISPEGRWVYVTGREDDDVIVIDARADTVRTILSSGGTNARGVAISADGRLVFVSNQDSGDLVVIDATTNAPVWTAKVREGPRGIAIQRRGIEETTNVREVQHRTPEAFRLAQNYPNPFNPATTIEYEIATRGHVELAIYDLLGQRVRTLVSKIQVPGAYRVVWHGRDDASEDAASGVYLYVLRTSSSSSVRRMVLLR